MSDIAPSVIIHPQELTQHPLNSNTHSQSHIEELAASRDILGQYRNIVLWESGQRLEVKSKGTTAILESGIKYVLAGNGLLQAAILRGEEVIEVKDRSDLSFEESLLLMETDNASPLGSKPDPVRMRENLERARGLIADNPHIVAMLDRARAMAGVVDGNGKSGEEPPEVTPTEAERLAEVYGTRLGQVWELGEHRLVVGDCMDKAVVDAALEDEEIESVITDPPYGIDWDTDYTRFTGVHVSYRPVISDNKWFDPSPWLSYPKVILWGANWYCQHIPLGSWLVWDKRHSSGNAWLSDAEIAWMKSGRGVYLYAETVQGFLRKEKSMHPTQKPVGLMMWCIQKADVTRNVFDPYLGSGSTLIAAHKLGKCCRGAEIDPGYAAVSIQRFFEHSGIEPKLLTS